MPGTRQNTLSLFIQPQHRQVANPFCRRPCMQRSSMARISAGSSKVSATVRQKAMESPDSSVLAVLPKMLCCNYAVDGGKWGRSVAKPVHSGHWAGEKRGISKRLNNQRVISYENQIS
jgi:hypothetical protein